MAFTNEDREELGNYFLPNPEYGTVLPNPRDVRTGTIYFLQDGIIYIEHIMIKNAWYKKVVDSHSQVILEKV